ncbi:MAG TPA: AMP-binding protein [Chloroflexi bacterium]|nr:AMP-binding protein [Chloroflexota bacterium]
MATADWYEKTNKHFGDILDESASRYPHKEFIVFKDQRITYAQFQHSVNQFARGLLKLGVKKDENVALWMSNCAEWPVAQFAVYKIGAALLPLNTRFVKREVEYCLSQSDASTLILRDRFLGEKIDAYGMLLDLIPELPQSEAGHLKSEKFPKLKRVILLGEDRRDGTFDFHEVLESGQAHTQDDVLQRAQASVSPFDVMNVVYTSGTTGFPKGGLSPHRTNCSALYQYVRRIGITEQDRTLLTVPFFTNFGVTYVSALSILVGMSIIVHESFSPEAAMQAIEKERITFLEGAPAHYVMILNDPHLGKYDLSSLRIGVVGGAPAAPETIRTAIQKLGFKQMFNAYGLSECGGLSTTTLPDDPVEVVASTVGVAFPSCRVKIVDPHTFVDLPPNTPGEIWLHDVYPGSAVGKGYYNMPEKTGETITEDGWFRTGDLGILDDKGYLKITGRAKDMLLVGGYNVYAAEIENVLFTHPKVKMAAVFGVPDERLGEVAMAYVELKPGEDSTEPEIIEFCRQQMANYKVPRYIGLISGSEFPMTGSAKVQKFKLRDRAIRELGLKA